MNIKRHYLYIFILLLIAGHTKTSAQNYRSPLDIPHALSANFGELRSNHFHSGLDFKTQQVVNKPIYAIEDGYISRIGVSAGGYGLALYIDHPTTGHTSVYGHLNSFSKKISDYVVQKQYEEETYVIRLDLEPYEITVKKGEQIALSGNTGSSGGPHLHFEIRDTYTQDPIDPLNFYAKTVADTQAPDLRGIAFYPIQWKGSINHSVEPLRITLSKNQQGQPLPLNQTITAWGDIGIGFKAYDRMNGQNNIYGVRHVRLFVDGQEMYNSTINRFSFADTRMLNTHTDYEDWKLRRSFYTKTFIEPGNRLPFYQTTNRGIITIDEERDYNMQYELEDYHGNITRYTFKVKGQKQDIHHDDICTGFMPWSLHNSFINTDFALNIPSSNLYNSICYEHNVTQSTNYYSNIYTVHDQPVPLHNNAQMWIQLHTDTLKHRQQYGIVTITPNGKVSWLGGDYKNGGVEANIRELGNTYAISSDTTPPVITPVNPANWSGNRNIRVRINDNLSGVKEVRATINDQYILLKHDMKSPVYSYQFDNSRLQRGQQNLSIIATDAAGNKTEYNYSFNY